MSATIVVCQKSGLGYSATTVSKNEFYFLSVDSNVLEPADAPITIPEVSTVYSYECWLFFRCDVAPSTRCYNFKIWTAQALQTGQNITINTTNVSAYIPPVNSQSANGTRANLTNYTSGSKLDITGELVNVGDISGYMVFQLEVASTASPGTYESYTTYYQYDEE